MSKMSGHETAAQRSLDLTEEYIGVIAFALFVMAILASTAEVVLWLAFAITGVIALILGSSEPVVAIDRNADSPLDEALSRAREHFWLLPVTLGILAVLAAISAWLVWAVFGIALLLALARDW